MGQQSLLDIRNATSSVALLDSAEKDRPKWISNLNAKSLIIALDAWADQRESKLSHAAFKWWHRETTRRKVYEIPSGSKET